MEATINEQRLWQSVVLTAVKDALLEKSNPTKYSSKDVQDARNWLLYNRNNYFKVCTMANINPEDLREKVKNALAKINALPEENEKKVTKLSALNIKYSPKK